MPGTGAGGQARASGSSWLSVGSPTKGAFSWLGVSPSGTPAASPAGTPTGTPTKSSSWLGGLTLQLRATRSEASAPAAARTGAGAGPGVGAGTGATTGAGAGVTTAAGTGAGAESEAGRRGGDAGGGGRGAGGAARGLAELLQTSSEGFLGVHHNGARASLFRQGAGAGAGAEGVLGDVPPQPAVFELLEALQGATDSPGETHAHTSKPCPGSVLVYTLVYPFLSFSVCVLVE